MLSITPRTTTLSLPGRENPSNTSISGKRTLLKGILIGLLCCSIQAEAAAQTLQTPTVSYSSPQVYMRNSAISNLSPTAANVPAQTFRNVTTYAGTGTGGSTNNTNPLSATFEDIVSMVMDARGNMYVAESSGGRSRIRRIAANGGAVVTLMDLNATNHRVWGLAINGSTGDLYFSVTQHAIYRVPNTNSSNYPGQDPSYSSPSDGTIESNNRMAGLRGTSGNNDNTTGTSARLNTPLGMDLDATNAFLYVADKDNGRVRKISLTSPYAVTTVSTTGVTIATPEDLVLDPLGVMFATSTTANVVYRIGTDGVVTNFAGSATAGYLDGQGTAARFNDPRGIDMDAAGNLYVADGSGTDAIRKITSGGYVSTLAGSGTGQSGTTEGVGTSARFNVPMEVIVDRTNSLLFVGDNVNDKIRKVEIGGYTVSPSLPDGLSMSATTGVISGTPTVRSRQITYSDDFDDAAGGTGTSIAGNASYVGGWMRLIDAANSQDGAFRVDASGVNTNGLQVDFKFINGKTSNAADGMSYSFAPDAATTGGSSPSLGTGTGLSLSLSTWSGNTIKTNLYYGSGRAHSTSVSGTLLASNTSNNALWLGRTANISLSIDDDGKVTVKVDGTTLFNQVQLPAGYASADKSTWYHVFRATSGSLNDVYAIDDLVIRQGLGAANHTVTAYNADGRATSTLNINVADLPTVAGTTAVSSITSTTASTGGNITADGGSAVTTRGVVWNTSANPTVALSTRTSDGTGTGSFTSSLTGLNPTTTYYVRAYATTAAGTTYGPEVSFTTLSTPPGAPTAVTGRIGVNSAYIDFTAPASTGGVAISNYEYSLDGGTWTALSPAQTNSPLVISGLTACTPYSIKIRAVNSIGSGTESSSVMVTPRNGVGAGLFATRSAPEQSGWRSITYGNGLYVAVANSGTNRVMTSPDGVSWTVRSAAENNSWMSVTYGNGLYVAVANSGTNRVMTSPDGVTWTARAAAENSSWMSVTYGNGLFVAVANGGTWLLMTSPDGVTWTRRSSFQNSWQSVTFGNGMFVAVGNQSIAHQVMTSPDGVIWNVRNAASASSWMSVAYGNGRFLAVANSGTSTVMTSDDNGISWTSRSSTFQYRSVAYGNGVFMATNSVATSTSIPISSDGGVTWQVSRGSSGGEMQTFGPNGSLTYGPGQFVGLTGASQLQIMNSRDILPPDIPTIGNISTNASSAVVAFTPPSDPGSDIIRTHAFSLNNGEWQTRYTNPVSFNISGSVSFRLRTQGGVNSNFLGCPTAPVTINPLMPTSALSDITHNSATSGGNVPSLPNITQSGVVWDTGIGPTVELASKTERGSAIGAFTSSLSGLAPSTAYFIRSYVVYNGGADVLYGEVRSFRTNHDMSTWMSSSSPKNFGDGSFNLTAPSSNGSGRWTYGSSNTSVATISGNTVTIRGTGSTTITATQAAVSPYASATASYTLIVNGQTPVINLGIPLTTQIKDAGSLTITPTSNSGGTVTLTLGSGSIGGVTLNPSGSSYTLSPVTTTGNLVFQASVPATGNYAAGTLTQTLDVTKNNPTITFTLSSSTVTYASGLTQTLTATGGGSSQPLTFTIVSGPGNITGGNILNITAPGYIVVKASQDGDATHNAAPDVVRTLTVNAGSPTIAGFSPVTATVGDLITITGDNLLGATAVTFGGTAAASYSVVNGTTITAVLADGHTGSVSVTTPSGSGSRPGFRFKAIWTGSSNAAFSTAGNWTGSRPPQTGDDIVFSPTAESDMELSAPLTAANVDFNGSARTLNLGNHNLTITGNLTLPGSITGTGRLIMGGSAAQTIAGGGSSLTDLEINNTGGGVTLSGTDGELVVTGRLSMTGGSLNANGKLRLSSTFEGTARVGTLGSGASITGDVIAERYIPQNSNASGTGRAWRLVSVPVTGAGTLRDFFMNGRAGQDLTLTATRSAETANSGTPIVGHNHADATAATTAGTGAVRGFDWIGVANQVSSLRRYVGDGSGGTFLSENVPDLSTSYASADQGYMVFTRGDRKVEFPSANNSGATTFRSTGTLKTGTQSVSVASAASSKYTLVGNPYMSVLDLSLVHADAANSGLLKSSFWIWDANIAGTFNQGAYVNVFKSGDQWVTNTGTYTNPERIESGMAFFVEPVSSGGTLTISESHKSSEASSGLSPFSTERSDDHGRVYVRLEHSIGSGMPQIIDGVMADFHTSFRTALGDQSDREKLVNGISRGALWMSLDNKMLSSQGLPWPKTADSSVVPIMMSGVGSRTLVLKIDPQGMRDRYVQAWLKDKVLKRQIEINMNVPTDYDFIGTGSAAWDSTRFELVFTEAGRPTTGGVAIEPGGGSGSPSVRLYPNPSRSTDVKLSLRSMPAGDYRVQVLDMTGRLVADTRFTHRGTNGEYRVLEGRRLSPGKYIVRLIDGKGGMQVLQMASE